MKKLRNLLIGAGMAFALSGCPNLLNNEKPVDNKRHWADIMYVVKGEGTFENATADTISYGRRNANNTEWEAGYPITLQNVKLPWSKTFNDCTGHYLRLSTSICDNSVPEGSITLEIKDKGKPGKQQTWNGNCFVFANYVDYYITTQK